MKCKRIRSISVIDSRFSKTLKQRSEFCATRHPLSIKFFNDLIYNYPMCCTAVGEKRVPDEYGIIEFDMLEFPNRGTGVPTLTDYVREYDEN